MRFRDKFAFLRLYPRSALGVEHIVTYKQTRGAAIAFLVVNAGSVASYRAWRVVEKFVARFEFAESLFERAARAFYFTVANGFFRYVDYARVAMAFEIMLTVARSTFKLHHIYFLLFADSILKARKNIQTHFHGVYFLIARSGNIEFIFFRKTERRRTDVEKYCPDSTYGKARLSAVLLPKYSKSGKHIFYFLPIWGSSKGREPLANLNEKEVGTTSFIMSPTCADIRFYRHKA